MPSLTNSFFADRKISASVCLSFPSLATPHVSEFFHQWSCLYVECKMSQFQKLDFENPNERKFLLVVIATEENTKAGAQTQPDQSSPQLFILPC